MITHLYNGIGVASEPPEGSEGQDGLDLAVTFRDAGRAVRSALDVSLARMPSRCEMFFISADLPHGKCAHDQLPNIVFPEFLLL